MDELLLVGHSLGMVLLAEAVVTALGRDPTLLRRPCRFALVGLGSSLLKIALMPAAGRLRDAIARLAVEPGLIWLDYASRRDIVSFHRANPIDVLGLPGNGPRIEIIHPRDMVDARVWQRICLSVLRQHRHYVMGNERRYFFDYGLMLCGPGAIGRDPTPDHLLGTDVPWSPRRIRCGQRDATASKAPPRRLHGGMVGHPVPIRTPDQAQHHRPK